MAVNDPLTSALADALEPLVRRLVDDAVRRAHLEWRWRTSEQTAELLGITAAAVRQRTNRGQLHAYKFGGRNYYDVRALDAAIRDGGYDETQRHDNENEMALAPRQRPRARHQEV